MMQSQGSTEILVAKQRLIDQSVSLLTITTVKK
jgi:hypothetical protein